MGERKLKLNIKNTVKIGFAFFGILMLWQIYNSYCPIILTKMIEANFSAESFLGRFTDTVVGFIMALDNIAAIFIMPIVGSLSDKTKTKHGKRMPYIILGMLLTIIVFPLIALMCTWNLFAGVLVMMFLFLVIMQAYRSPAVAFMPDITPKPLRSTANGIINLLGYFGAVFATVLGMVYPIKANMTYEVVQGRIIWPFIICTFVFVAVLIYLVFRVKEPKLLEETKDDVEYGETLSDTSEVIRSDNKLSKKDARNLILILISIFFWFMSFNSFETFGTKFGMIVIGTSGIISTMSTVLSVTSILTFILFASLSNKIGRKWTIVLGLILTLAPLAAIGLISLTVDFLVYGTKLPFAWTIFFLAMAVLMGIGWALININSFPMVVEFSNTQNIGKFTSYYYIASMVAQSITPVLVGIIMDDPFSMDPNHYGIKLLFVYAAVMMAIAFVVFMFVKDKISLKDRRANAKEKKKALENLGDMDI